MNDKMKILVTGAGGFIGGWVVESYCLSGVQNIRAGLRRWSSGARVGRFPVEAVMCDVLEKAQVERAMEGVDVVIHCALGSRDATFSGTENMLSASLRNRVKRFIHLSTINVYGDVEGEVDETYPFQKSGDEYSNLKIETEELCWRYLEKGLPLVVLRPTVVYGPFSKLWITKLAERLRSGNWGTFKGFGEGFCNLVYIADLINAISLSLESEKAIGQAFNINGSEVVSWNGYFCRFNKALGLPELSDIGARKSELNAILTLPIRSTARCFVSHHGDLITQISRRFVGVKKLIRGLEASLKTTPSLDELGKLGRKARYSISKARSILGYEPAFSVDAGLEMSVRWLTHESLLSHDPEG